jgi:hypothetical protein
MYVEGTTDSEFSSRAGTDKRPIEAECRSVDENWQIEPEVRTATPTRSQFSNQQHLEFVE